MCYTVIAFDDNKTNITTSIEIYWHKFLKYLNAMLFIWEKEKKPINATGDPFKTYELQINHVDISNKYLLKATKVNQKDTQNISIMSHPVQRTSIFPSHDNT